MELIEEMKKYDLGVLGISETKWKGSGAKDIGDAYAIYSGVNEGRARAGVAVVLSEQMRGYVKSWKCVSERIVVKLKVSRECYTLVQVYAPTDDSKPKQVLCQIAEGRRESRKKGNFNSNRERLLRFCSVNELIVANTWYSHNNIHESSWVCPGRQLKSLIYYFLVRRDTKATVHNVKVVRGAE